MAAALHRCHRSSAPGLLHVGMVTDALWRDFAGDARLDLSRRREWILSQCFETRVTAGSTPSIRGFEKSNGWWNGSSLGRFHGDGRVDFVVGNLGLNTRCRASATGAGCDVREGFRRKWICQQVIAATTRAQLSARAPRRSHEVLPFLTSRYANYETLRRQTLADVFLRKTLLTAVVKSAYHVATVLAKNNGERIVHTGAAAARGAALAGGTNSCERRG